MKNMKKKEKRNLTPSILSYELDELSDILSEAGFEKYRAKQIFQFLYEKEVKDFSEMSNISKNHRDYLQNNFVMNPLDVLDCRVSNHKDTHKYLFQLADGYKIESVLIKEGSRNTLCLSTQVGCSLKCSFCATGKMGLKRNLKAGEIIAQFLYIRGKHGSIDNIVYMGMGEPFLNYNNVIKSVRIFNSKDGLNFGIRRITLSTAGMVKGIYSLVKENLNIHLAVSLNSPFQSERVKLMPSSKKNNELKELIKACEYYQEKTGQRITFEYVMIKGVNMRKEDAKQIIKMAKGLKFNLNLISYNVSESNEYQAPIPPEIARFVQYFQYSKIEIVQRKRKGKDISAACGQLATSNE